MNEPTVYIVDDDDAIRESLDLLIRSAGLKTASFPTAQQFLDGHDPERPGCVVLDLRMPGINGLELQERMVADKSCLSIIFVTGHGDVPAAVSALRSGAIDFIQKPFDDQELLDRIQEALEANRGALAARSDGRTLGERLDRLTPREREVMGRIVSGQANKAVAYDLELSERTVEIHRSRVMKKMEAESLAQLVQMVTRAREIGLESA
ncbi:MAG: response regulator transcription factor [Gemmatimonadetes bacterium]|nr:response regulator transcription factor [Gemmatimonadota bacterium]